MSDTIEYRAEYFNRAYKRWEPLNLRTSPITPEVWPKIVQGLKEKTQGVQFRLAMRTCTPWCACQAREGSKESEVRDASKVYTAQEMREYADAMAGDFIDNDHKSVDVTYDAGIVIIECLRQAADAEEENAQLKARLNAVVKECKKFDHLLDNLIQTANDLGCELSEKSSKSDKIIITAILRAARGEGGAE